MLKLEINMRMPKSCTQCPFYMGSRCGGDCIVSGYGLYFADIDPSTSRHHLCPLEEVYDD